MTQTFGWTPEADAFQLGSMQYRTDGRHGTVPVGKDLEPYLSALSLRGSLEPWVEAARLYCRPGAEPFLFGLLTAFAAPLMRFTPFGGAVVSLRGPSGAGKTTCQRLACAVYGDPYAAKGMILTRDANARARSHRLGALHSLPLCVDEITNMRPADVSDLCYSVSQGMGPATMSVGRRQGEADALSWQTLALVSTNSSIYDKLGARKADASAEAYRALEFAVNPLPVPKAEVDALLAPLRENYGVAGHVYLRHIAERQATAAHKVSQALADIENDGGVVSQERYWSAAMAACLIGGLLAYEQGLLPDFRYGRLYEWCLAQLDVLRSAVGTITVTAEDTLRQYIAEHDHMLAEAPYDIRDATRWAEIKRSMARMPAGEARLIRYQHEGQLMIHRKHFRAWCQKNGVEYARLRDVLMEKGIMTATDLMRHLMPYVWKNKPDWCLQIDERRLNGEAAKPKFTAEIAGARRRKATDG